MTLQEKLEWALMTIREKLEFGQGEIQGMRSRERRCRGVLIDAVQELPIIERNLATAEERVKNLERELAGMRKDFITYLDPMSENDLNQNYPIAAELAAQEKP